MSLKGNLKTFLLPSLLQMLCNDKKTGVLEVYNEGKKIQIYMKEGNIIYAVSSDKKNLLGDLARRKGIISAEKLQECIKIGIEKKMRLGNILLEKGYVSKDTLKNIVAEQAASIVHQLFLLEKGDFEYKDIALNVGNEVICNLDTMQIIFEASRRVDEWSIVLKQIPDDQIILKVKEKRDGEIKINNNEWTVLSLIDGRRTIKEMLTESNYDDFALYKILYSLISSGLIEKKEIAPPNKKEDTADFLSEGLIKQEIDAVLGKRDSSETNFEDLNKLAGESKVKRIETTNEENAMAEGEKKGLIMGPYHKVIKMEGGSGFTEIHYFATELEGKNQIKLNYLSPKGKNTNIEAKKISKDEFSSNFVSCIEQGCSILNQ